MVDRTKAEGMLFMEPTSYLYDFHKPELRVPRVTSFRAKAGCVMRRPPPLKDVHTMSEWKAAAIPFDLLHQPRAIIGTNPRKEQKRYEKPKDLERAEAQRTRPRLVMTPAVSLDDVTEERARSLLCGDMYTSSTSKALAEAAPICASVRAPFAPHPAPANPITLPKLVPPVVPPEWRMESVRWDGRQLRAHTDTTRDFWLNFHLPKCRACDETAIVTTHRDMLRQRK